MEQNIEQVVRLDENTRAFEANGRRYIVHDMVTADGYAILEELRLEMETGNSAGDLVKLQGKAIGHLQKNNIYDASVCLYNALNISERISTGKPAAWLLQLTLFVRPEGSNIAKWDESEAATWIADWNAAGIGIDSLFFFHNLCLGAYVTAFNLNSQTTSSEPKSESEDSPKSETTGQA